MLTLSDVVDQLFNCIGPLRACEQPFHDRCLDPLQENLIAPVIKECIDPVALALEINPLSCIPGCGVQPSLPQYASAAQQENRARQLGRTQQDYRYNYTQVRTFRVESNNGKKVGVQGKGIAVLESVPFSQMPNICWLLDVLQHALVVIENVLTVLDVLEQAKAHQSSVPVKETAKKKGKALHSVASEADEPDIVSVTEDKVSYDEIKRSRDAVVQLRNNLVGTLGWGRKLAYNVPSTVPTTDVALDKVESLQAPVPIEEARANEISGRLCDCPRCSPQAFTRDVVENLKGELSRIVEQLIYLPLNQRPHSLKAYNDLFQEIPLPKFALTFRNDELFAQQRVAGQNPLVIEKIDWTKSWAKKFPVTPEQFTQVMGEGDSLEAAGKEGRLYLCDYGPSLTNTEAGDFPEFAGQKYLNAPLALFALSKADRTVMKAVAIQVGQEAGPENPIITPDCGWNWEIAKSIVQNSDCNDSEYYRHLGGAHLLTEAFILATYRQLPNSHPLFALLTPHFQNTLFTNNTAVTSINQANSFLNITEAIFSGTVASTLGIAANAVSQLNFTETILSRDLRNRGVDDPALLPNYPYRDDALLIWDSIHSWVNDYLRLYYRSDGDVVADYELQGWVTEVSSRQGGRIKGVGDGGVGGSIKTLEYLIDCVTQVIFTASAHHALTNFPLEDYEIYAPGLPGALYHPPPKRAKGASRKDWLSYFAPLNIALLQQALGFTVGGVYFTCLGEYPICQFADGRVRVPLMAFQQKLKRIEETIRERNMTRVLPYPYLLPSRIPQSTNI